MSNKIDILTKFDKIFGTETIKSIDEKKIPLLITIFKKLGDDLYLFDDEYEKLRKQKIQIESKLIEKFTDEQEMLYTELWDIDNKMVAKRERQLFSFGFIIAKELDAETKIIE